ncbi:MAG: pyrroline-5-carboxylate reductase [Candidatus Magasanikbacteria bacterium]
MPNHKKITIIGGGVMGEIFAASAVNIFPKYLVMVCDPNVKKLTMLKKKHRRISTVVNSLSAVKNTQVILLAVKPQSFIEVARQLQGQVSQDCLVISIMAGVNIKKIQKALGIKKVIRAMPNMGARINKSTTVWMASEAVRVYDKKIVRQWFDSIGFALEVKKETLINSATAIAGSGPGFFFYLVEEWLKAASQMGFSQAESKKLLFATIAGANELLQKFGAPEILKQQVASKGGTTEIGLRVMSKTVPAMWRRTLAVALKRAQELS